MEGKDYFLKAVIATGMVSYTYHLSTQKAIKGIIRLVWAS